MCSFDTRKLPGWENEARVRCGDLQIRLCTAADKAAISAPILWLSLRDRRLAVGFGLVPSIPLFRSVRDYSRRASCSTVPMRE